MTALRAGFIGTGFMGQVHTRAARAAGAELAGVAASSAESAERAARSLGAGRAYASPAELIADETIDVVHILTPNSTHAAFAAEALEAGKHVVCEKPLATSVEDAARVTTLAAERGLVATVPYFYRFHPIAWEARARVARGEIGRLLTVQGQYLQDWLLGEDDNWRVDAAAGGRSRAFGDIGSHLVDLVEFVSGERVTRIGARVATVRETRGENTRITTEDAAAVLVETESGAIGTLLVSQVAAGRKNALAIELSGAEAAVRFEQETPDELWVGRRDGSTVLSREGADLAPDAARLSLVPAGHPMGYQDAANAFVRDTYEAIAGGDPEGLPTFLDGWRSTQVIDAVLDAAASDGWVDVPAAPSTEHQTKEG